MNQTSLFSDLHRASAPRLATVETRREAHEAIKPAKGDLHTRIVNLLRSVGPLTDEEMQDRLGMNPNTQRPRRRELEQAGRIRKTGGRRPTRSGMAAALWGVV